MNKFPLNKVDGAKRPVGCRFELPKISPEGVLCSFPIVGGNFEGLVVAQKSYWSFVIGQWSFTIGLLTEE